ncbi:MAG: phosphatidylserine/phosphatidylglycerophosphate/cardiolipin synthase family protein [Gemmatimonadota bacterium]|nr:phosphatidylserine/phosphatidylglycerophosphate/cardiolipin synthase family protein [Gemmatimonadota bacterium]
MKIELLVDSAEFWARLQDDVRRCRQRVYLQTMSFEGDRVGVALGEALESCGANDRRLLVDSYSLLFHNDRLIPGPAWLSPAFRAEFRSTLSWISRLRRSGVGVRLANPLKPRLTQLLKRNHKKLVVVDDRVSYIGGINFCEHNFDWHDAMLRIESPELAEHLSTDFLSSWQGTPKRSDQTLGHLRVLSLNGERNPEGFAPVLEAVEAALDRIDVVSPYLSPPFTDHLAEAARRGVRVRVLTPRRNNKVHLAAFIQEATRRHGFRLHHYPHRMNHTKAMIIDERTLVVGSTNFDTVSYYLMDELFVMTDDPALVQRFRQRIWDPDAGRPASEPSRRSAGTVLLDQYVRGAARLLSGLTGAS